MRLLVFAHFSESRAFLEKEEYASVPLPFKGLWRGEKDFILVGGEGTESACRAAYVLGKFPHINALYNLGTAAGLSSNISPGSIHSIRTCYRCRGEREIAFHSFTSSDPDAHTDMISCDLRVTTPSQADFLESFAPLADREAHSLARTARRAGIPFRAFKLVSDFPASPSFKCEDVLKQSRNHSLSLLNFYHSHATDSPTPATDTMPTGFYFTATMKRRYDIIKNSLPSERLNKILHNLEKASLSPKERGKTLLRRLEKLSLPAETERELEQVFSPLDAPNRRIDYGRALESPKFSLQTKIQNQEDIETLIADLKKFDYSRFEKIFSHHV